jgi:pimeloyl-ACP methyl ester carboxylesterase
MPTRAAHDRRLNLRPTAGRWRLAAAGLAIAAASGLALLNLRLARRSEARHPPRGAFITVDGVRLHYRDQGVGPPIVLLHGVAVSGEDFVASGMFDRLSQMHRVIVFDRPGYGYSSRPRRRIWTAQRQARLLLQALAQLGVERPLLVGHSYGALVAAYMGLQGEDAVAGLALLSGCYRPTPRPDATLIGATAIPVAGDLLALTLSPWLSRLMAPLILKIVFAPAPVSGSFKRGYPISQMHRPSELHATAADMGLLGWDAYRFARRTAQLRLPMLIIAGRQDRLLRTASHSEWLHRRIPQSCYLELQGAGHMVHHTKPNEVASAILSFAGGTAPGSIR